MSSSIYPVCTENSFPVFVSFTDLFEPHLVPLCLGRPFDLSFSSPAAYPFFPLSHFPNLFEFPLEVQRQCHEYLKGEWERLYNDGALEAELESWGLVKVGVWEEWWNFLKCCLVFLRILRSDRPFGWDGTPRPSIRALYSYLFCLNIFSPLPSPLSIVFVRGTYKDASGTFFFFPLIFAPNFFLEGSTDDFIPPVAMVEAYFPGLRGECEKNGMGREVFSMADLLRLCYFHLFWVLFLPPALAPRAHVFFITSRFTRFIFRSSLAAEKCSFFPSYVFHFLPALQGLLSSDRLVFSTADLYKEQLVSAFSTTLLSSRCSCRSVEAESDEVRFCVLGSSVTDPSLLFSFVSASSADLFSLPGSGLSDSPDFFPHFYFCSHRDLSFSLKTALRNVP